MTEARRRRLSTLALVVALLTAGLLGTVDATQQVEEQLTTGHSVFADASTSFNSCFGGLAGALLQQVTWFNGQTLFSKMEGGGEKYVYVTEHFTDEQGENGEPDGFDDNTSIEMGDPTEEQLYRTNQTYRFTDPNGNEWTVKEYFALRDKKDYDGDRSTTVGGQEIHTQKERVYVFVVQVDEATWDSTLKRDYNFAMVIDTCRFHQSGGEVNHTGEDGTSGSPWGQHDNETGSTNQSHEHGTYNVDIFVGGEPTAINVAQIPEERDRSESDAGGTS